MDINVEIMRNCGKILADTLKYALSECMVPGNTPYNMAKSIEGFIRSHHGATPAFMGYRGFPESACISVNSQVVHTIPKVDKIIKEGDIVSVDCGVLLDGHYTDACRTAAVGEVNTHIKNLIETTKKSLDRGIEAARPGVRTGEISFAIQRCVERAGFYVSRRFIGHGIGKFLHGPPGIPNYGPPWLGDIIDVGACLAIEPVVFDGPEDVYLEEDGWTVNSKQGNLSAHFEDTILITQEGPEILTR